MCLCIGSEVWKDYNKVNQYLSQHDHQSILHLKDIYKERQLELPQVRIKACDEIPFKVKLCKMPMLCCGACTKPNCSLRCVQDVLNRYYMRLYPYLAGHKDINGDDVSLIDKNMYKVYMNPKSTFSQYIAGLEQIMTEDSVYDYTPYTEWELTKGGRYMRKIDPSTGIVSILSWPDSGLCPYCEPRIQVVSTTHRKKFASPKR